MKIERKRRRSSFIIILIAIAAFCVALFYLFFGHSSDNNSSVEEKFTDVLKESDDKGSGPITNGDIDVDSLRDTVSDWAETTRGEKGVMIYDLDHKTSLVELNADKQFNTASLYKLFVVYEGYRRISSGEWQADNQIAKTGYSVLDCLDLSIRKSYSPCAEAIWKKIGHDKLQNTIENDWGIDGVDMEGLSSSPEAIVEVMKLFYQHDDILSEYTDKMKDSFLVQPADDYDWRQGLPAGFEKAKVYNKVGWDYNEEGGYWNIYNDAAIIEVPELDRHFVVVVMTRTSDYHDIKKLGNKLEDIFYSE